MRLEKSGCCEDGVVGNDVVTEDKSHEKVRKLKPTKLVTM